MKKPIFLLMVLMLVAGMAGCGSVNDYVVDYIEVAKQRGIGEDYLAALQTWTREKTGYSEFETKFHITATYRSKAFNAAFLKEQGRTLHLQTADQKKRSKIETAAGEDFTEFFFYAYTKSNPANDFADRGSMWRVFLVDAQGRHVEPWEIRKINPIKPVDEAFFPYINRYFGVCYTLRFPRQSLELPVKLVFASVLGSVELVWK